MHTYINLSINKRFLDGKEKSLSKILMAQYAIGY